MLRCIIVDDESGAIQVLTRYVNKTPDLEMIKSFRDSIEALTFLTSNQVDLVFLDIDMPNLDGMQFSDLIRNRDIQVIFCTAYSEFAVESYEKDAIDYLLKPIGYERFLKAINKALKIRSDGDEPDQMETLRKGSLSQRLFIKSGPRIHQVDSRNILYMEKKGHYVVFHTSRGELLSRMNMSELMSTLPADNFIRVHRSFVVAIDKIDTIQKHRVLIKGKKIPIGDSYQEEFFKHIPYTGN
jgi:DNA-binding LytR/AlgR family response regulator